MEVDIRDFCLNCCCKVGGEASFDSPYRACGSGGLANSLGGANCVPYTCSVSIVPGPRPAYRRLQYGYCKRREAELGPGKRLVARAVSAYQSSKEVVVCCLQASCFTNPQHYCTAGNKTGSKSPKNQKKCVVANALLLYSK